MGGLAAPRIPVALGAAALGAVTHYFIAFGIVATYFVVSRRAAVLTRHPIACGIVYGLLVYLFMNRVVIPLSAIGAATWPALPVLANGLLIHAFGIGIPSASSLRSPPRSESQEIRRIRGSAPPNRCHS